MGQLFVNEKSIVAPGEQLAEGMDYLPVGGAFREGEKIIANQVGVVNVDGRLVKVIPLRGKYLPKRGDVVIGKIVDMTFSNWFIDIGCPSSAVLSIRDATEFVEKGADLSQFYSFGDFVVARISNVTRGSADLTMRGPGLKKLGIGRIMHVGSSKVPRIIGKQGSMISLIKQKTGCRIIVGQNGMVWIQGNPPNEHVAAGTIALVDAEAHHEGLTDRISKLLDERMNGIPVAATTFRDDDVLYQEQHHDSFHRREGGYHNRPPHSHEGFRRHGSHGSYPHGERRHYRSDYGRGRGYYNPSIDERKQMRRERRESQEM